LADISKFDIRYLAAIFLGFDIKRFEIYFEQQT
jgi:hypothetical protein